MCLNYAAFHHNLRVWGSSPCAATKISMKSVMLSEFLGQHPIKDVCITLFQHEMRAAPAWAGAYEWWWNYRKIWAIAIHTSILRWWMRLPGGRQAQPGVATGHNVLAWRLGYVEVFTKKWYINWRLDKLSLCLIRTNSSLEYKRWITAGSCPGNELVWTD